MIEKAKQTHTCTHKLSPNWSFSLNSFQITNLFMYIDLLFIHICSSAASSNIKRPLVIKYLRFDSRVLPLCTFFSFFVGFFFSFAINQIVNILTYRWETSETFSTVCTGTIAWKHQWRPLLELMPLLFAKNASSSLLFNAPTVGDLVALCSHHMVWSHYWHLHVLMFRLSCCWATYDWRVSLSASATLSLARWQFNDQNVPGGNVVRSPNGTK